jgi:hypothetical protein
MIVDRRDCNNFSRWGPQYISLLPGLSSRNIVHPIVMQDGNDHWLYNEANAANPLIYQTIALSSTTPSFSGNGLDYTLVVASLFFCHIYRMVHETELRWLIHGQA